MVARAFSETSGKTCSRISPRAEGAAEDSGAFADGNVPVRREAGAGAATAADGVEPGERSASSAVFFPGAVFVTAALAEEAFEGGGACRRAGCDCDFGWAAGWAGPVEAEEEGSGRRLRIFGSARMVTTTNMAASTGTTWLGRTRIC